MKSEVHNTTIEAKTNFSKAYGMLPASQQADFRESLKEVTGWSHMTFHNKRKGNTPLSPLEIKAVEAAFEDYNLNAWTGEYIKQLQD